MGYRPALERKEMTTCRLLLLSLLLCVQGSSWAQQEALGRLFFTPQQRAELDRQRLLNPGANSDAVDNETSQTFNGEVRRSNGRSTRWINGEAKWNDISSSPRVPVGDTFYPRTGEHQSVLGGGRIVVKPGSSGP